VIRVTEQAHQSLRQHLGPGDLVVDATCGNGHDTELLADLVGAGGKVFACDIQQTALDITQARLNQAGLLSRVTVHCGSHANWNPLLPPEWKGQVQAFVYNLGYLPNGDKSITTLARSTLQSLQSAAPWLAPTGAILIVAYPGHEQGSIEADEVENWWNSLQPEHWKKQRVQVQNTQRPAPILYTVQRLSATGRPKESDSSHASSMC
jgi:SAM-dependent methyltransferase